MYIYIYVYIYTIRKEERKGWKGEIKAGKSKNRIKGWGNEGREEGRK